MRIPNVGPLESEDRSRRRKRIDADPEVLKRRAVGAIENPSPNHEVASNGNAVGWRRATQLSDFIDGTEHVVRFNCNWDEHVAKDFADTAFCSYSTLPRFPEIIARPDGIGARSGERAGVKKILITGATGFVGAFLAHYFVERGHDVHVLVRSGDSTWRLRSIDDSLTRHVVSLFEPRALDALFTALAPDWVFHLAAYGAYSSQRDDARIFETNLVGTRNLLDAAQRCGVEAFVNTGSSSEYGLCDRAPLENQLPRPNSMYAYAKAAATLYASYLAEQREMPVSTVRLYSVYGPLEEPTRLLPTLLIRAIDGGFPPLVEPSVARDFIYVEDVARAYETIAGAKARSAIYNIGTGIQTTLGQAVETIREQFAIVETPVWGSMANRSWDTGTWVANIDRARSEVGWSPRVDFREGCIKMADWLVADPERTSFYRAEHPLPH